MSDGSVVILLVGPDMRWKVDLCEKMNRYFSNVCVIHGIESDNVRELVGKNKFAIVTLPTVKTENYSQYDAIFGTNERTTEEFIRLMVELRASMNYHLSDFLDQMETESKY